MRHLDSALSEIHDLNLSYLVLVQKLLRADLVNWMCQLSLDKDTAEFLRDLTLCQIKRLSDSNTVLCNFCLSDYQLLSALDHGGSDGPWRKPFDALRVEQRVCPKNTPE